MEQLTPRMIGERVWFRLSDVPIEKRRKAAEQLAEKLTTDPGGLSGLAQAAQIRGVAEQPNGKVFNVTLDAWTKAIGAPP